MNRLAIQLLAVVHWTMPIDDAELRAAASNFAIDSSMSPAAINAEVAKLTALVQSAADEETDERRSDALADTLGELENIDLELDHECVACEGAGTIGDDGDVGCPACDGSGESPNPTASPRAIEDVRNDVRTAFKNLK